MKIRALTSRSHTIQVEGAGSALNLILAGKKETTLRFSQVPGKESRPHDHSTSKKRSQGVGEPYVVMS